MKNLTLLKQTITLGFISSTILLTPLGSQGITVEEVTNPRRNNGGWVTDMADVLSDATESKINRMITELEETNGTEIAVVTVSDTPSFASPKAFATELFNYWGICKANLDNGVLFLISISDRRVEIETGTGLQNILPDDQVKKIIDTKITPQYKKGNFDRSTVNGTSALIVALNPSQDVTQNSINSNWNWGIIPLAGGMVLVLTKVFSWWLKRLNGVFIDPTKTRVNLRRRDNRDVYCAKCQQPMERTHHVQLTQPQQIAQKLGGVSFRCYKCSTCSDATNPYVTFSYFSHSNRYQTCPHCNELTVIRTEKTIEKATKYSSGKFLIEEKCHSCDYQNQKTKTIPRLYSSSRSSNNHHYHSSGSSCGGSDGGGSFGGGGSDGGGAGGAGGDW